MNPAERAYLYALEDAILALLAARIDQARGKQMGEYWRRKRDAIKTTREDLGADDEVRGKFPSEKPDYSRG